jgi:hypothetical protein
VNEKTAQSTAQLALGPVPAKREGKYTFLKQENEVEENFPGDEEKISIRWGKRRKGSLKNNII